MKIYSKIRMYIENKGLKFNSVAEKSNIQPKRFYRLINGDSQLGIDEYEKICNGLGVDPGYFFKQNFLDSKTFSGGNKKA